MAKQKKVKFCFDWKAMIVGIIIVFIAWGIFKATYQGAITPQPPDHECLSSAECSTGYICYIHRFCGTPYDPTACNPFSGDLKCHKGCSINSDCPSGQACETRIMWVGDTGTGVPMCFDIGNTCQGYCENQTHILCLGQWNISGEYPNCTCQWLCDESGPV